MATELIDKSVVMDEERTAPVVVNDVFSVDEEAVEEAEERIVDDNKIHLNAEVHSFETTGIISISDIGNTSRLGSTPIERWLYFTSCFQNQHEHQAWSIFKVVMIYFITLTVWLGSFALACAWNVTSCVINVICSATKDDSNQRRNDDHCGYISMFDVMYHSAATWTFIFSIIFMSAGLYAKVFFTIVWFPVLVLNARCIWECHKYVDTLKSYPGNHYCKTKDLLDGKSINKIVAVELATIEVKLSAYHISTDNFEAKMTRLQMHATDEGMVVLNIYNSTWKQMYFKYTYTVWLWLELIILLTVFIIAWASK
jgi:hypothetical protein